MKISNNGIDLIKYFEGFKAGAYKPYSTETYYTIGYGHYGPDVGKGDLITVQEAHNLMLNDLKPIEQKLNKLIDDNEIIVNQSEYDALCSIIFNIGLEAFEKSTMLRKLKLKSNVESSVVFEFSKWVYAGGTFSQGLARRRFAEAKLFCGMDWQDVKSLVESKKKITQKDVMEISCNG